MFDRVGSLSGRVRSIVNTQWLALLSRVKIPRLGNSLTVVSPRLRHALLAHPFISSPL
jgi:hypothetical protein